MLSATSGRMHLRFVSGRPVSRVSKQVKTWLREHNQTVLQEAQTGKAGVRIITCWLPTKSPWLNRTLAEMGPWQASHCRACSAVDCE